MRKMSLCFIVITALLAVAMTLLADSPLDKFLTVADVEKASGIHGVTLIPHSQKTGGGRILLFGTSGEPIILMFKMSDKLDYLGYKKAYFKTDLTGLGDQAFQGISIPGNPPNMVIFTKGNDCVYLVASAKSGVKPAQNFFTIEQLIQLAKIVASRM